MAPEYLSRDTLIGRLRLAEDDYPLPDGGMLRLRELMAADRMVAEELGEADLQAKRYRNPEGRAAYIVQRGVIDPETREPLFDANDIATLATTHLRGYELIADISARILRLSEADADSFRGRRAADDHTRDAAPVGGTQDGDGGDPVDRPGARDDDQRADGADGPG